MSTTESPAEAPQKHASACILCDSNCGIEITVERRNFIKIQGDRHHPSTRGYTCQKAIRLNHYQNNADRLTRPLKRSSDGKYEPIGWDQAVTEIAERLRAIRDTHGGHALAYYGGGGQGNHMQGAHGGTLRKAMGTRYIYTALAQEKTGDFWVAGELFGRQDIHDTPDQIEHADFVLIIGSNPWMSHGFPRARVVLKNLANDPTRTLVVIDPYRTKTAELADVHIAVTPGQDAFLMAAVLAVLVKEDRVDHAFITERTTGYAAVRSALLDVPVAEYCARAGVAESVARDLARGLAAAKRAVVRHDLGLEQSLHSTLNTYLKKLLFILTGNLGREGTNVFHTALAPLIGHSAPDQAGDYGWRTKVTGMMPIAALYPPNILPLEINSDHPERVRGLVVDSANPMMTAADTRAYGAAFDKLELLVTIDVAFTETARKSDYILPAASQYEKWEATFFNFGFPTNFFHVRRPILAPLGESLPESEIYRRLVTAMGEKPMPPISEKLYPELDESARLALAPVHLSVRRYASVHREAVKRAGITPEPGETLGDALFRRIINSPSGTEISTHTFEDQWSFLKHADKKIHLAVPLMLEELGELRAELTRPLGSEEFPFILAAGERRAYNANQIYRDPDWRKSDGGMDREGGLRIHPEDAARVGLADGARAYCESARGRVEVIVALDPGARRGFVSLPHGYGMDYGDSRESGERKTVGPRINELTATEHCDRLAKTPFHKYVPVRVKAL